MEALWNYFYWQTLTTNPLDDVGHVLRLSVIVNECSPYQTNPTPATLDECNEFLGPAQPGVTTPDPTEGSAATAATAATTASTREGSTAPAPSLQELLPGFPAQPEPEPQPQAQAGPAPLDQPSESAPPPSAGEGLLDFLLSE